MTESAGNANGTETSVDADGPPDGDDEVADGTVETLGVAGAISEARLGATRGLEGVLVDPHAAMLSAATATNRVAPVRRCTETGLERMAPVVTNAYGRR